MTKKPKTTFTTTDPTVIVTRLVSLKDPRILAYHATHLTNSGAASTNDLVKRVGSGFANFDNASTRAGKDNWGVTGKKVLFIFGVCRVITRESRGY